MKRGSTGQTGGPGGSLSLLRPRTFDDLRRLVRRHTDLEARQLLNEIEGQVDLHGWRRVQRAGGPRLDEFFERATEVFNEISSAVFEIVLTDVPINRLVGKWDFRFPVEDLVLDRLHSRHLGKRIVLIDGDRAFVRDGLGVRMEAAEIYAPSTFVMSAPPVATSGSVGPMRRLPGLFDELPGPGLERESTASPN
jgi:hypothetical protein